MISGLGLRPRWTLALVGAAALLFSARPVAGQAVSPRSARWIAPSLRVVAPVSTPVPARPASVQESPDSAAPVSPGGAFLRSLLVPGWGDAAAGAYGRAGFYFVTSAATGWMLFKTARYLHAAREDRALAAAQVEAGLRRQGITNPDTLAARIATNEEVKGLQGLVDARSSQMQDWTALGVFWLLLNATDAFVSAHLADFPQPVEIRVDPGPPGGRSELRLSVPVGR